MNDALDFLNLWVNVRLRVFVSARWTVVSRVGANGATELVEYLDGLRGETASDRPRVLRRLLNLAQHGSISNAQQCRLVEGSHRIYELKGDYVRVFFFLDEGRIVVCSHATLKPKKGRVLAEAEKAERFREEVLLARKRRQLVIEEEDP